jgi:nitrous oxidase accessory protein
VLIRQRRLGDTETGRQGEKEKQRNRETILRVTASLHHRVIPVILTALLLIPSAVYAKTLVVGVEYQTIKGALTKAEDGDVIEIRGGEYKESLKIQRGIHLKGINNPVISVNKGNIVEITKPGVIFEGFTLRYDGSEPGLEDTAILISSEANGTIIRNNKLLNVTFGIRNVNGENLKIENNIITGIKELGENYRGNCINLTGSQKVHVVNNALSYCRDGIYMDVCHDARVIGNEIKKSRYSIHTMWVDRGIFSKNIAYDNLVGLAIMYTKHSEISNNLSYGNKTHGILFIQTVRSKIADNTVVGNTKGIFLYNSVYNEIKSNLVMNNQLGIHNWGGSEDNMISGNSFINNEIQVKYIAGRNQEWNGNYWSDYIGWDMNGDGTGDNSYESNSVVDYIFWRYPLAKVLYASPSLHVLWMLEKQFPIFDTPKVEDKVPSMRTLHANWKELNEKYASYTPSRQYGEISKMEDIMGGGF